MGGGGGGGGESFCLVYLVVYQLTMFQSSVYSLKTLISASLLVTLRCTHLKATTGRIC